MEQTIVIAIDGPAGAGKSSVARMLAKRLEIFYLDTGAMYRAFTYKLLNLFFSQHNLSVPPSLEQSVTTNFSKDDIETFINKLLSRESNLAELLRENNLSFALQKEQLVLKIELNENDISEKIRWPLVAQFVSIVASSSIVRKVLVELQREFGKEGNMVMEGRDIGSRVFPQTPFKCP